MPVYSTNEDISDDEIIARGMTDVLTSQVINRVDPETQYRRDQKRKRQQQQYELERN